MKTSLAFGRCGAIFLNPHIIIRQQYCDSKSNQYACHSRTSPKVIFTYITIIAYSAKPLCLAHITLSLSSMILPNISAQLSTQPAQVSRHYRWYCLTISTAPHITYICYYIEAHPLHSFQPHLASSGDIALLCYYIEVHPLHPHLVIAGDAAQFC